MKLTLRRHGLRAGRRHRPWVPRLWAALLGTVGIAGVAGAAVPLDSSFESGVDGFGAYRGAVAVSEPDAAHGGYRALRWSYTVEKDAVNLIAKSDLAPTLTRSGDADPMSATIGALDPNESEPVADKVHLYPDGGHYTFWYNLTHGFDE